MLDEVDEGESDESDSDEDAPLDLEGDAQKQDAPDKRILDSKSDPVIAQLRRIFPNRPKHSSVRGVSKSICPRLDSYILRDGIM